VVTWTDSGYADASWSEARLRLNKPMPAINSVGWLYKKTKKKIILFSAWACMDYDEKDLLTILYEDGQEGCIQEIETKNILDIKEFNG
jgi:hypothetical protein